MAGVSSSACVWTCGRRRLRTRQAEDILQVLPGAQVAPAQGDSFEDGVHQRQFVLADRDPHQHQRAVPFERPERRQHRRRGAREHDGRVHPAPLLLQGARRRGGRLGQVGPRGARHLDLVFGHIRHRGLQPFDPRHLQRQVAQPAEPEQRQRLAARESGLPQGPIGRPSRAAQRSRLGRRKVFRHAHQRRRRRDGETGQRALDAVAEISLLGAVPLPSRSAPLASPAGSPQKGDAGPLARRPGRDARARRFDPSDALVSQRQRHQGRLFQSRDE